MTTTPVQQGVPAWIPELAERIRADRASLPSAMLADAMRERGEDPRDNGLFRLRLGQLDGLLFIANREGGQR